jgi:hypothetical protein
MFYIVLLNYAIVLDILSLLNSLREHVMFIYDGNMLYIHILNSYIMPYKLSYIMFIKYETHIFKKLMKHFSMNCL